MRSAIVDNNWHEYVTTNMGYMVRTRDLDTIYWTVGGHVEYKLTVQRFGMFTREKNKVMSWTGAGLRPKAEFGGSCMKVESK